MTTTSADGRKERLGAVEAPFLALCNKALKGNDMALVKAFTILLGVIPAKDLYFQPGPELKDPEESLRTVFEKLWAFDAEISASAIGKSVPKDLQEFDE